MCLPDAFAHGTIACMDKAWRALLRVWGIVRHILSVRGLLQWTGKWETVTAAIAAAGLSIWSWAKSLPGPLTALVALGAFVLVSAAWRTWKGPSASDGDAADPTSRTFTDRTPDELLGFYKGMTGLQADKLIEPYKHCWIKVTGTVMLLLPDNSGFVITLHTGSGRTIDGRFPDSKWANELGRVHNEDSITIEGMIAPHQNGQQLYLRQCELVAATREHPASDTSFHPQPPVGIRIQNSRGLVISGNEVDMQQAGPAGIEIQNLEASSVTQNKVRVSPDLASVKPDQNQGPRGLPSEDLSLVVAFEPSRMIAYLFNDTLDTVAGCSLKLTDFQEFSPRHKDFSRGHFRNTMTLIQGQVLSRRTSDGCPSSPHIGRPIIGRTKGESG